MAGAPDWRPPRRIKLTRHKYDQLVGVMLRKTQVCECGCGRRAQTAHHVVRRGHGDDIEANLMVLAGDGTRLCHGAITSKQRVFDLERGVYVDPVVVLQGLRRRMETVRLDTLAYALERKGRDWLETHYPR